MMDLVEFKKLLSGCYVSIQQVFGLEKWLNDIVLPTGWVPSSRQVAGHQLTSDVTVSKSDVGLGNVANVDTTNPANITPDSTHRFVTDTEKGTWNGKADPLGFTPEDVANKATDCSSNDDSHYPTTQAVNEAIAAAGTGIPAGGTTGQALVKDTDADYDVIWDDVGAGTSDHSALSNLDYASAAHTGFVPDTLVNYGAGSLTGNLVVGDGGTSLTHGSGDEGYYNTLLGVSAGDVLSSGYYNIMLGASAGMRHTTGYGCVFIGYGAGAFNTIGHENFYMGTLAGLLGVDANYNFALGSSALFQNVSGAQNVAIGYAALYSVTGNDNIGIGYSALNASTGHSNTAIGSVAATAVVAGNYNTFIGHGAAWRLLSGGQNCFIGERSGYNFRTGCDSNICIGFMAGPTADSNDSSKLYINAGQSDTPLIGGDFGTGDIVINGNLQVTDNFGLGLTPIAPRTHVADPSGGTIQDAEARTAINSILATLEAFGFHLAS